MATSRLSLDLSLRDKFQSLPFHKSVLAPDIDTRPKPVTPSVLWALNVMASQNSVRSLSFATESIAPIPPLSNINSSMFRQVEVLDTKGNLSYMLLDDSPGPTGTRVYYLLTADKQWTRFITGTYSEELYFPIKYTTFQTRTLVLWTAGDVIDPAFTTLNPSISRSFLEFDLITKTIQFYPIAGEEQWSNDWIGVTSYANYMIVYTVDRIYWSDPLTFNNFVPALGGAGSARIAEARGPILLIMPNTKGLIIYCRGNIVSAEYSGDPVNPWIFTEVNGSAGIIIFEGDPVASRDEQSPFHVALTGKGLMFVSNEGAQQAPPILAETIALEYTEVRVNGRIQKHEHLGSEATQYGYSKIRRLDMYGNHLFILIGELAPIKGEENYNRMLHYNMQTEDVSWLEGDIRSVVPALNLNGTFTTGRDQHKKISPVINSFVLTKRVHLGTLPFNRNVVMDLVNDTTINSSVEGAYAFNDGEIMLGSIQLKRNYVTHLYEVQLFGQFSQETADHLPDADTVATIEVYTEYDNWTMPSVFVWCPGTSRYTGYAEGAQLQVLIKGKYLKLTDVELEVALGGRAYA